jgi:predicted signal transduction protein with EAL and GGDEF domain
MGDRVLHAIGERLRASVRPQDLVARLGGDEFALLAPTGDEIELMEMAQDVRAVLLAAVHVDSLDLAIRASIGITARQPHDTTAAALLRRADVAMYQAKSARSGAVLYQPSHETFTRKRLARIEELREAIQSEQLRLWYQPQVDAVSRRLTAIEALVRWEHPSEGLLSPMEFLPDARRAGLMPALSDWVVRTAVLHAVGWHERGADFRVAMNCAPAELLGGSLLPKLFESMAETGLPGDRLLIEVTEDSFLSDPHRARDAIRELRDHGVQVAIDDYGTGFSSLSYLRDLPVQELKMDRSFVASVLSDERTRLIVQTTTNLAHAMGLRLVAEGVEDETTAQALLDMDVDLLQGYHIARPMPAEQVYGWARRWATTVPSRLSEVLPGQPAG